jgi:uncharacterized protein with PIN domain
MSTTTTQNKFTKFQREKAWENAVKAARDDREEAICAFIAAIDATEPRDDNEYGPCRICGEELQELIDADAAWKKACNKRR